MYSYPLGKAYHLFCKLLFAAYCPISVKGEDLLPAPPFILCSNHCSHLDTPALMIAAKYSFDRFYMIAAKDYFFDRSSRKFLSLFMHLVPLDRHLTSKSWVNTLAFCREIVQTRGVIIFYPEGTRSLNGTLQKLKKGAVTFAHHLQIPIVPAKICGTFEAMPKGKSFPRRQKISIEFGKPIFVGSDERDSIRTTTEELEKQLRI